VLRPHKCRHRRFPARILVLDQSPLRYAHARAPGRRRRTKTKDFAINVPLRNLSPGRHRLRVRAKDAAGNFARRVIRFRRCGR
jgi:hypothetical protein